MNPLFNAYTLARAPLFSMDPEAAHEATLRSIQRAYDCKLTRGMMHDLPIAPILLMGLSLKNPVGLAAGLDKNGEHIDALGNLGFGFVEVGTVTPKAQPGNPKPRMFRLPKAQALINRMGFNNQGLDTFLTNVKRSQYRDRGGILGLNIGKNASTPIENANDDYLLGLEGVYPHADYITINISSPNTKNLRDLQSGDSLNGLLSALHEKRLALAQLHRRNVPLALKVAPDLDEHQIEAITQSLVRHQMDGLIATNTTIDRQSITGMQYADEAGGLSGAPVHRKSLWVIEKFRSRLGPEFPIIGVGGIMSGAHAAEKIQAGANAVQLYTGLIYKGPALIADSVNAITKRLR
ncbi:quinone-dependent dihydroorotate dehydrogenase [Orrella marina]|uniref:Dihydroorotate dehydrogenase (quinone) n=1 Tax=Orrella marina TaxID=2163011 RepID=A0A2R4XKF3_9BURK|nr:quinone-dependent dihydroorotate dehydrogenase [Orrella marina]AWB34189.1 dihydroorotate dehydrogenase (quinone) [Orrella marina]